jgi:hypothetical protein
MWNIPRHILVRMTAGLISNVNSWRTEGFIRVMAMYSHPDDQAMM